MKGKLLLAVTLFSFFVKAQQLTVEKIMQDPKWMGAQPSNILWGWDSKNIYFSWNPDKNISDSTYAFLVGGKEPSKANYKETILLNAISNGTYNNNNTQLVYTLKGDLFLLDIKTNKTHRITQTEDQESNPKFIAKDEWISYSKNQNLFVWHIKTGFTQQLTNFGKAAETQAGPVFAGAGARVGGG
ncbi:MAG: DPP IV N-terminal domain-containing protein, partial [Pedobacter sp.]|nr:DPP IV N-terminal domain-containing protein [Chitinophagaceae bacterium]